MYTLSTSETNLVSGGCPVCAISSTCFLLGASSTALGVTSHQILLLATGAFLLSFSLFYSISTIQIKSLF